MANLKFHGPQSTKMIITLTLTRGRGGGQVVSVLALNSDDPSLNLADAYSFSVKYVSKRTKINKKRPWLAHFFKKTIDLNLFTNCRSLSL